MTKQILLVVDDNADIRRLLQLTLGRRFEVIEAVNGTTAWASMHHHRPRAVILDVEMPGEMDGFQLCRKIRQDPLLKDMYVILVTARSRAADIACGKECGADDYIIKPYSPLQLLEMITTRLGHRTAGR